MRHPLQLAVLIYLLASASGAEPGSTAKTSWALRNDQEGAGPRGPANFPDPPTSHVMVHLFEWSWKDVALECESYLGPAGYKAVQVSPPQEDAGGNEWWTRYQPVSYDLISRSGDKEAFADMVKRCKAAGVDVIVDAVLNHMAKRGDAEGRGRGGTPYGPGCRRFPRMYGCQDFHTQGGCCNNCQYNDDSSPDNIHNCDLGGLPDLRTDAPWVQEKLSDYLASLADLGVAGIRVDAAKHIPADDLWDIANKATRQKLLYFNLEIAIMWKGCGAHAQDYYGIGRVWEFKLPQLLSEAFKGRDGARRLDLLRNIGSESYLDTPWADPERAVSWVVNHDRLVKPAERFNTVTYFDGPLYPLALIFLLAHPYGQPNILSSITFTPGQSEYTGAPVDPQGNLIPVYLPDGSLNCGNDKPYLCEHRWPEVAAMVTWRRVAGTSPLSTFDVLHNNAAVSLSRGRAAYLAINTAWQQGQDLRAQLQTGLPAGRYCNVLASDCSKPVTVGWDGKADLFVPRMSAVALHIEAVAAQLS